jgi:hypothetical protein
MKTSDKQLLRCFVVLTIMPLLVAGIGSLMNLMFSWVFMCPFAEVQLSPVWFFHILLGVFFTMMLLAD